MRDCLVLSYWFPPVGGAGTQRMAKACKYLPEHGWTPHVIAGAPAADEHAPALDESLLGDIAHADVVRVAHGTAGPLRRLLDASRFRLDMDAWVDRAIPIALQWVERCGFHAVVTSLGPYAGWRLGEAVQRLLGVPWVLDLRDPWALDGWRSWPSPLHARWDLEQMKRALRSADAVLANTPEAAGAFASLGAPKHRLAVVPNGFDETDLVTPSPSLRPHDRFVLVHVGTLHSVEPSAFAARRHLPRWRQRHVDFLGRSGRYLIQALAHLRSRAPALVSRIEVRLLGRVDPSHHRLAASLGVEDVITHVDYVDHDEAMRELADASAVFVPLHGIPDGERALVVPGKLFEALASGPPVLAALPPGDGADLVRLVDGGVVVPPCDAMAIAAALESLARAPQRELSQAPRQSALAPFSRKNLAQRLAAVLERTVGGASLADMVDPWQESFSLASKAKHQGR